MTKSPGSTPQTARSNIETIVRLEEESLGRRTRTQKISDAIAGFVGSIGFVLAHVVLFITWVAVNSGTIPILKPFDPYPYVFLTMIVSMEGVLISTFVLIKQNRMSSRSDQRAHLNLQIDLLAEKEITKILQLQRLVCERLGVTEVVRDAEATELSQETVVDRLARELERKLPQS